MPSPVVLASPGVELGKRVPGGGESSAGAVGGVGAHAGQDMLAGGHGEAGVGVAEAFGDDLMGAPCSDEQRRVGVAKSVEAEAGHVGAADFRWNSW